MQSACIQYPNFYGFVLWNLNVYKKLHSFFLLYNKLKKTLKPAFYLSFIFWKCTEEMPDITKNIPVAFNGK